MFEIGGCSQEYRALLAHYLKTTIPKGMKIYCCHACHNAKCSNIKHLYWGTASENLQDAFDNGRITIQEAIIRKYGEEKAKEICRINSKKGGKNKKYVPVTSSVF